MKTAWPIEEPSGRVVDGSWCVSWCVVGRREAAVHSCESARVVRAERVTGTRLAGVAGACIPILLKKMNIDPALAGSVVLTTVTDIVGIFAFLGTATWLLI